MTVDAERLAIGNVEAEFREFRKWLFVMSMESAAALAAVLACVIVALKDSYAPLVVFAALAKNILLRSFPALPIGGFIWMCSPVIILALAGTKGTATSSPIPCMHIVPSTILTGIAEGISFLVIGLLFAVGFSPTRARAVANITVFGGGFSQVCRDSFKTLTAIFTSPLDLILFGSRIAFVGAEFAVVGRSVLKDFTAMTAMDCNRHNKIPPTRDVRQVLFGWGRLAVGSGLFGAVHEAAPIPN